MRARTAAPLRRGAANCPEWLLVLHGRVRLSAGTVDWEGSPGDLLIIPTALHALEALEDAAVLLTVAKS